jgi:hypothetical protein
MGDVNFQPRQEAQFALKESQTEVEPPPRRVLHARREAAQEPAEELAPPGLGCFFIPM